MMIYLGTMLVDIYPIAKEMKKECDTPIDLEESICNIYNILIEINEIMNKHGPSEVLDVLKEFGRKLEESMEGLLIRRPSSSTEEKNEESGETVKEEGKEKREENEKKLFITAISMLYSYLYGSNGSSSVLSLDEYVRNFMNKLKSDRDTNKNVRLLMELLYEIFNGIELIDKTIKECEDVEELKRAFMSFNIARESVLKPFYKTIMSDILYNTQQKALIESTIHAAILLTYKLKGGEAPR